MGNKVKSIPIIGINTIYDVKIIYKREYGLNFYQ